MTQEDIDTYLKVQDKINKVADKWLQAYSPNAGVGASRCTYGSNGKQSFIYFYAQMYTSGMNYWNPKFHQIDAKYLFDDSMLEQDARAQREKENRAHQESLEGVAQRVKTFESSTQYLSYKSDVEKLKGYVSNNTHYGILS
jgi:hypothetical protein